MLIGAAVGFGARLFEQRFQWQAMCVGGRVDAKVALGKGNDLAFEGEQNSRDAHREDHDAGDAADGEMAPEENFAARSCVS